MTEEQKTIERNKRRKSFKIRTATGALMALAVVGVLFIPAPAGVYIFQAAIAILAVVGAYEMINMFEHEKKFSLGAKICTLALVLLLVLNVDVYSKDAYASLVQAENGFDIRGVIDYLPLLIATTIVIISLTVFDKNYDGRDAGKSLLVIFYVGLGMTAILMLRLWGVKFIVYGILISTLTDIFAYLVGSAIGKHKMAPSISPKKSWEGAIAGTIIATGVASCFALFYGDLFQVGTAIGSIFNKTGQQSLLDSFDAMKGLSLGKQALVIIPVTFLGAIVSQIGDLIASRFKRTYDIKDFGKIFPGHGGVMDRLDSIVFLSMFLVTVFLIFSHLQA